MGWKLAPQQQQASICRQASALVVLGAADDLVAAIADMRTEGLGRSIPGAGGGRRRGGESERAERKRGAAQWVRAGMTAWVLAWAWAWAWDMDFGCGPWAAGHVPWGMAWAMGTGEWGWLIQARGG